MSLLMDALRKAEKARQEKAAAERQRETGGEGADLSLDPIEAPDLERPDEPAAAGTEPGGPHDEGLALELEPAEAREAAEPASPEDSSGRLALEDELLDADASATLPSIKAAQASVEDYFDGTRSVSVSMEQVRAAMEEEDTAERHRPEVDTPARRGARTVLDSAAAQPPRSIGRMLAYTVLFAVVLGGLGVAGWAYWQSVSRRPALVAAALPVPTLEHRAPAQPPPAAAQPPAHPAAPAVEVEPAPAAPPAAPAASLEEQAPALEQVVALAEPAAVAPRGDLSPQPLAPASAAGAEEPVAPGAPDGAAEPAEPAGGGPARGDDAEASSAGYGDPDSVVENLAEAIARAGIDPGPRIRIRRAPRPDPIAPLLEQAYQAYLAGDVEGAAATWAQVLKREAGNRDALLGLAAVAVRAGRIEEAEARYRRVLAVDPGDSVARAALIELRSDLDPVQAESYIKELLAREPEAAWLYYSLGNLYAAQGRWAEAEEAYFAALRSEQGNADYAYNLAVSLDHLAQGAAALGYYRRALELADGRSASFAAESVRARIRQLAAGNEER